MYWNFCKCKAGVKGQSNLLGFIRRGSGVEPGHWSSWCRQVCAAVRCVYTHSLSQALNVNHPGHSFRYRSQHRRQWFSTQEVQLAAFTLHCSPGAWLESTWPRIRPCVTNFQEWRGCKKGFVRCVIHVLLTPFPYYVNRFVFASSWFIIGSLSLLYYVRQNYFLWAKHIFINGSLG